MCNESGQASKHIESQVKRYIEKKRQSSMLEFHRLGTIFLFEDTLALTTHLDSYYKLYMRIEPHLKHVRAVIVTRGSLSSVRFTLVIDNEEAVVNLGAGIEFHWFKE